MTMSGSFELDGQVQVLTAGYAERNSSAPAIASIGPIAITVFAESDDDRLTYRSNLGAGLAQITARLLQRLAYGSDASVDLNVVAMNPQRDMRGNRVPPDGSPLAFWRRVIAVSAAGRLHALVSLPVASISAQLEAQADTD
jgi:hypothetical protein